jgi:chromosome segregation ATPase
VSFDESVVASVGEDGVLTLWDVVAPHRGQRKEVQFAEEILIDKKDLEERNRSISDLHEKVAELKQRMEHQQHKRELKHEETLQELKEKFAEGRSKQKQLLDKLLGEKSEQAIRFTDALGDMEEKHRQDLQRVDHEYTAKIKTLEDQAAKLEEGIAKQIKDHEDQKHLASDGAAQAADAAANSYAQQLREADEQIDSLQRQKKRASEDAEEVTKEIETETDMEIMELKERYEQRMKAEQDQSSHLKTENAMMLGKETVVKADLDAKKEDIASKKNDQAQLQLQIYNNERDIEALQHELAERVDTIADKVKRIYDLQKKNEELGKFRFVLEYKISELNEQIAPRNEEIEAANAKYAEMEFEAAKYLRSNDELVLSIRGLKLKLDGQQREMEKLRKQLTDAHDFQAQLYTELTELHEEPNPRQVKEKTKALYYKHTSQTTSSAAASSKRASTAGGKTTTDDAQRDYNRTRDYMERTVSGLKKKLIKDSETNRADRSRITGESVTLIKEINELRREKRTLLMQRRGVTAQSAQHEAQRELDMQRQEMNRLRQRMADLERQLHAIGKPVSTAGAPTLS